jgi:hypothetical protein
LCRLDAVEELAQSFVDARLSIIKDPKAPSGDRLRAMEQLESRALGRPNVMRPLAGPHHVLVPPCL